MLKESVNSENFVKNSDTFMIISPGSKIHFIGICGAAMANVAVALKERGYLVSGSDAHVYPPMSTFLEKNGISLKSGYTSKNLSHPPDLIVVGNAISRGNPELEEVLNQKWHYLSLPEVLKEYFLIGKRNLVVTGTHGKTTIASLLTWILECADKKPSYMIGGIPKNLGRGACFRDSSEWVVLEGDEYDTSFFDKRSKFLHYLPEVVIINNIEFDHADIYDNLDAIKLTFKRLVNIIPSNGLIVANGDDPVVREVVGKPFTKTIFVGCDLPSEIHISNIKYSENSSRFSLNDVFSEIPMNGLFNVRNASMAITVARHIGIADATIQKALTSFEGVKRRQEIRAVVNGITIMDDFGHHPTAIRETLIAIRHKYSKNRLWIFFEPRSNTTRRAIFQNELSEALSLADGIFISQVARLDQLPPDNRLNPEKLLSDIRAKGREAYYLPTVDEIVSTAVTKLKKDDVAIIFSNGSFGGIHDKLIHALQTAGEGRAPEGGRT